jgi:predicted transcriptional regulator of viral defense system
MKTDTGIMHVSAPEETALDLVEHAHEVGGIDAIANILVELGESLEPERLAEAAQRYPSAVVQRLGWLLERVEWQEVAMALKQVVLEKANGLVWLRSDAAVDDATPEIVRDWRVAVERDVELDG